MKDDREDFVRWSIYQFGSLLSPGDSHWSFQPWNLDCAQNTNNLLLPLLTAFLYLPNTAGEIPRVKSGGRWTMSDNPSNYKHDSDTGKICLNDNVQSTTIEFLIWIDRVWSHHLVLLHSSLVGCGPSYLWRLMCFFIAAHTYICHTETLAQSVMWIYISQNSLNIVNILRDTSSLASPSPSSSV